MLVTRGIGNDALLPTAGMGVKGGTRTVVRNQWVRQWAIEQILANQAAADKKELEEKLRENRAKIKQQAPPLEIVYTDDPAIEQDQGPAKRQRRRPVSRPATRAPRHDHSAASRAVVAGLFAEQARIKAQLAAIEAQVRDAYRQAVDTLDLEPVKSPFRPWAYAEMARDETRMLNMFTARAAQKAKKRKQEEEALALVLTLVAA